MCVTKLLCERLCVTKLCVCDKGGGGGREEEEERRRRSGRDRESKPKTSHNDVGKNTKNIRRVSHANNDLPFICVAGSKAVLTDCNRRKLRLRFMGQS